MKNFLLPTLLVGMAAAAHAQSGEALNYMRFLSKNRKGPVVEMPSPIGRVPEVEINSSLQVKWDLEGLVDYALASRSQTKGIDTLLERLQTLTTGMELLLEVQDRQMEFREKAIEFFAESDENAQKGISIPLNLAFSRVVTFARDARARIEAHKATDPGLAAKLETAAEAIGRNDIEPMAAEVSTAMLEARDRLAGKLARAESMYVTMSARIEPPYGRPTQLHLDGFDNVETGRPTEFARVGKILDSRTKLELDAAKALLALVRDFRAERLDGRVKGLFARAQQTATMLAEQLSVGLLQSRVDALLATLQTQPQREYEEVISGLIEIRALLSPIDALRKLQKDTDVDGLIALAGMLDRISKGLNRNFATLPERIATFVPRMAAVVAAQPREHAEEVLECLRGMGQQFVDPDTRSRYQDWAAEVGEVRAALGLISEVTFVAKDLVPRDLPDLLTEEGLDTSVDLTTMAGERHPGDHVVVEAKVFFKRDEQTEEVVTTGEQRFRVEAYGLYSQPRSALIFVDPRGAAPDAGRWDPVPTLGYHWRYGIRNNPAWNQTLALGVGVSFSLLDFDKDERFELGVAASVTAFKDLLWFGYGRNIQARSDYFYIGLNPMALRSLFRR